MNPRLVRVLRRPATAAIGVVVLVVGLGIGADLSAPAGPGAGVTAVQQPRPAVPVARADAACPDPVADERTSTRVSIAAPGPLATEDSAVQPARAGVGRLSRLAGGPLGADVRAPASGSVLSTPQQGPMIARGTGAAAPGLAASMLTRSTEDTLRGLSGTACVRPGTDFWFVGSGAVVGQRGRVYLTNPEAAPALVDITLYGPAGPLDAPAARGIPVAAGEQVVRLLDALAPGTARFAVHVRVRNGRVAAAVRDQQVDGLTPRGADWLPVAAKPARRQVVPGVVGGAGARWLQVVAPGGSDAIVKLRLITASGAFTPAGRDVVEVRSGSVAEVNLGEATAAAAVAVELNSDVPVTAGVLIRTEGAVDQLSDLAYSAAARALLPGTPGVVPAARQGEGVSSVLLLSAIGGDATVLLAPLPPATGSPIEVAVSEGRQRLVDLATVSTASDFALTVTPLPGSAPVLAARAVSEVEARGPLLSIELVEPGRYEVRVPRVVADLSSLLRSRD